MKKFFPQMETINEASKISGLAKYRIRQMVLQNKVKYVRAGKKYLINIESLIEYLNQGEITNSEVDTSKSNVRKVSA